MKRRIAIVFASMVFVAAVELLVGKRSSFDGPVYQGSTTRQWFADLFTSNRVQASDAFLQIGSNAVPFLVRELQKKDSAIGGFYVTNYPKLPLLIRKQLTSPPTEHMRWLAAGGLLSHLPAKSAVPDLTLLLEDDNADRQFWVLAALEHSVGHADTNCIPAITSCMKSKDARVCLLAIRALERIGPNAQTIPALTNLILTNLMNSRYDDARYEASTYLRQIDPKMAAKFEMTVEELFSATNAQPALRGK